jgi:hypothetical protein
MPYHRQGSFPSHWLSETVTENIEPRPVTETSFSAAPAAAKQNSALF